MADRFDVKCFGASASSFGHTAAHILSCNKFGEPFGECAVIVHLGEESVFTVLDDVGRAIRRFEAYRDATLRHGFDDDEHETFKAACADEYRRGIHFLLHGVGITCNFYAVGDSEFDGESLQVLFMFAVADDAQAPVGAVGNGPYFKKFLEVFLVGEASGGEDGF